MNNINKNKERKYDLVSIGRCGVDLYSNQLGDGLEDALSFNKYVGGCPANIAIGTSRLGLRVAMLSRVGKEQMGNYLLKTFAQEGVDTQHMVRDAQRLTTLVLLSIRDAQTFPLLYYRKDCADMGLCEADIRPELIADTKAILISGVHLASETTARALFKATELARANGTRILFDIDYRPVLWGLTELGMGESRFVANKEVTANIQRILPRCDLIVGTDEEFNIAGGSEDPMVSLRAIRALTQAVFVFKMGAQGCCVIQDAVPDQLTPTGKPFAVDIVNSIGAGDAFMSGFLRGYLRDEDWSTCATWGNAAGALVVSRHGCSPESPSYEELRFFMARRASLPPIPDADPAFRRLHHATNRPRQTSTLLAQRRLCILAFDHRSQFETMADAAGLKNEDSHRAIARAKMLIWTAFQRVGADLQSAPELGFGIICDSKYGKRALQQAHTTSNCAWIARPVEKPQSYPLQFDFERDIAQVVESFPAAHIVKCLFWHNSADDAAMQQRQLEQLQRLYQICEYSRHQLLLEILPRSEVPAAKKDDEIINGIQAVYANNIFPDWWKLPNLPSAKWKQVEATIEEHDKHCYGILLLGQDKPLEDLQKEIATAAGQSRYMGFAVGRSIFGASIRAWFAKQTNDEQTIHAISDRFTRLAKALAQSR